MTEQNQHKRPTAEDRDSGQPSDLWLEAHAACDASRDDMWDWLEDRYWNLIEQYEALREERDRLRVMLDAILPEKTTFHIIEGEMPGHHIPISPDEYPATEPCPAPSDDDCECKEAHWR